VKYYVIDLILYTLLKRNRRDVGFKIEEIPIPKILIILFMQILPVANDKRLAD
jgi:hypothetical protein